MQKNNIKKNILTLLCGGLGIILVVFVSLFSSSKDGSVAETEIRIDNLETYTHSLEDRIKKLCEACEGVSSVSVMITLEGGFEYEYAKNTEYSDNNYGNSRTEEYLVLGQGSNQKCVLLREKLPVISGVGIVCRGAENESVKSELVLLVASALNIGTNKIYITEAS